MINYYKEEQMIIYMEVAYQVIYAYYNNTNE